MVLHGVPHPQDDCPTSVKFLSKLQGCVCWSTSALGTSLQGLCIPPVMLYCLSTTTGLGRGGSERGVATTEGGVPSSNGTVRMPECTQHH